MRTLPKTRTVLMVLVPVVTACIAWQLLSSPEAFRAVVVVPTSAVLRAFRGAAAAVGEIGFWAILVVAFAASAIAALRASGPRRRDRSRLMPGSPSRDELTFWEARLSYVRRSLTARQSFAAELRRLVIAVLAFAEGTEAGEIEERVARGEVELPPSVAAIVAAVPLGKPPRRSFLARVFRPVVPGEEDEARAFLERTGDAVDYLDKLLGNGGGREN